jgi:hypothetical protein
MYCTQCGKRGPDGAKYCAYCGAKMLAAAMDRGVGGPSAEEDAGVSLGSGRPDAETRRPPAPAPTVPSDGEPSPTAVVAARPVHHPSAMPAWPVAAVVVALGCLVAYAVWPGARRPPSQVPAPAGPSPRGGPSARVPQENALFDAVLVGDATEAGALLDAGVDANVRNSHGETPLHYLKGGDDLATLRVLLAHGADTEAANGDGDTALHLAVMGYRGEDGSQRLARARALIEAGARVDARDRKGMTPLHYAGSPAVAELLLEHGADLEATDKNGCTPLHRRACCDDGDTARVLRECPRQRRGHAIQGGAQPRPHRGRHTGRGR